MSSRRQQRSLARTRFPAVALLTGLLASLLLAGTLTGTLSAFTASITAPENQAATGTVVMEISGGDAGVTCVSTDGGSISSNESSCSTLNVFGASTDLVPGTTATSNIAIRNTGTAAVSRFQMTPGPHCTVGANGSNNGSASDLCSRLRLDISSGPTQVFSGTLASFAGDSGSSFTMPAAPAPGGSPVPFSFAITLDDQAPNQNSYQGLSANVPITWSFAAGTP